MYEYQVVNNFSIEVIQEYLNSQAEKGWRLVTVTEHRPDWYTVFLEREIINSVSSYGEFFKAHVELSQS
jgi:hypothetical protein